MSNKIDHEFVPYRYGSNGCAFVVDSDDNRCMQPRAAHKPTAPAPSAHLDTSPAAIAAAVEKALKHQPTRRVLSLYGAASESCTWCDCNWPCDAHRLASLLEQVGRERDGMFSSLRSESARLDWVLGSYILRRAILKSGKLDADTVNQIGLRGAIDGALAAQEGRGR